MTQTRSFYSVIQYVPDSGRMEAANVGVVLLIPSKRQIEIRTSPNLDRVRRFFAPGKCQLQRAQLALEALKNRLSIHSDEFPSETEFANFVAARADVVRLTAPRLAMIGTPSDALNELYLELVGDVESSRQSDSMADLPSAVAGVLGRLEAERRIWRPGAISIPKSRRRLEISFAYQNGSLNYVRTEALAGNAKITSRLEKLGFNGQLIHEHPPVGQKQQLVVLSSDPAVPHEVEAQFETTLHDFHVRFVPYHLADEFIREIDREAHAKFAASAVDMTS